MSSGRNHSVLQISISNPSNFTADNIIEILSWLPASSLSRFKFVCKPWRSLITIDPHLRELHFTRGHIFARPSIITLTYEHNDNVVECCLNLMDVDGGRQHCVFSMKSCYNISPGCNGLLCIYSHTDSYVALFNPTTREHLVIREQNRSLYSYLEYYVGYIPTTKEYKMVRLYQEHYTQPIQCEVLTIGTSLWRKIAIIFEPPKRGVVTIKGVMYWILCSLDPVDSEIMSFDMKDEVFKTIQFSRSITTEEPWPRCCLYSIFELEGRVCVTVGRPSDSIEIWMLENITNDTWIRRYRWGFGCGLPLLIHEGKFLVYSSMELWFCDLKTGAKMRKIYSRKSLSLDVVQVHNESLVCLTSL